MQTVDPHTLKAKRDNISTKDYEELQKKFTDDGIATYTEFILALPGDTYELLPMVFQVLFNQVSITGFNLIIYQFYLMQRWPIQKILKGSNKDN